MLIVMTRSTLIDCLCHQLVQSLTPVAPMTPQEAMSLKISQLTLGGCATIREAVSLKISHFTIGDFVSKDLAHSRRLCYYRSHRLLYEILLLKISQLTPGGCVTTDLIDYFMRFCY